MKLGKETHPRYLLEKALMASNLTPTQKAIGQTYASHIDEDWVCWPGKRKLAEESGFSKRTVDRAVKVLIAKGYLVELEHGGGRHRPNRCRMMIPTGNEKRQTERVSQSHERVSQCLDKGCHSDTRTTTINNQNNQTTSALAPRDAREEGLEDGFDKGSGKTALNENQPDSQRERVNLERSPSIVPSTSGDEGPHVPVGPHADSDALLGDLRTAAMEQAKPRCQTCHRRGDDVAPFASALRCAGCRRDYLRRVQADALATLAEGPAALGGIAALLDRLTVQAEQAGDQELVAALKVLGRSVQDASRRAKAA